MPTSIDILTTDRVHLSRDELQRYAAGSLEPTAQHEVEMHLEQCPLCSDAVEGLLLVPVHTTMDDLQWKDRAIGDATARLVRGVLLGSILLAGIWVTWQFGYPEVVTHDQEVTPLPEETVTALMTVEQEEVLIEEIEAAKELPENELIGTNTAIVTSPIEVEISTMEKEKIVVVPEMIDTMEPKLVTIERAIADREPNSTSTLQKDSRQLIYLYNLK